MIRIEGGTKRYGSRTVLDGLTFDVPDGHVAALVAPNGAGKTTCLRTIAGAVDLDAGSVFLDGQAQTSGRGRVPVAFAPETRATWPTMTPREVLARMAAVQGIPARERADRVEAALRAVRMGPSADRRSERASTGEARKLALAGVLLAPRRNVVLDEPTNGLDIPSCELVEGCIRALRAAGHAVLVASHSVDEIGALADSVVCLVDGRCAKVLGRQEIEAARGSGTLRDALRSIHVRAAA